MSARGRKASLPPADHSRPESLAFDRLTVRHYNSDGRVKEYDFSALPVAEPLQRSLAALFAARCASSWTRHGTSKSVHAHVAGFATFLSQQEQPPRDLDEISAALVKRWWLSVRTTAGGRKLFSSVTLLLRGDARLQTGPVVEELARRVGDLPSTRQSFNEADFEQVKLVARRMFRAALLRIEDNARHLERWRGGEFTSDSRERELGEALDVLARTGALPHTRGPAGQTTLAGRYRRVLGGATSEVTWQRLFLSRREATALGVLLMAEYGWNLSVIDRAVTPRATADPGMDGHPTYRIPLVKYRRGAGRHYETENVTDSGAGSPGRLITQALRATRFARVLADRLAPGTDHFVAWRTHRADKTTGDMERPLPVGPIRFGVSYDDARDWGKKEGIGGSPFQRGRRTVLAVERGERAQHSQETHDRTYVLPDQRVQAAAVPVIAAGAASAVRKAREAVKLAAMLSEVRDPAHAETATADCSDADGSPVPAPGGGCGASFLLCLACTNARVHADHHPRLGHLHQALTQMRSVLPPSAWERDWGDTHARLEDLKNTIGDGGWRHALARITDADREIVDHLLTGELNP
ncbi:hypothetical protein [Streptomyces dysideae]|uniref:Uncharacterized protein n=1 Tax=Streptomyces dysideae TaxID=909626 RepID=A0A117S1J6_9ACTN|nr:hypothetical protein [Streptomyces dysideae]KUO20809.1 hypothetical protein AQJ91_12975 [Streptomyces dysideae]